MLAARHRLTAVQCLAACLGLVVSPVAGAQQAKAPVRVHTITIEAMRFTPERLEVRAGDTVVWRNRDPFPHSATARDKSFNSGEIGADAEKSVVMQRKGETPYFCTLHPTMTAVIVVR